MNDRPSTAVTVAASPPPGVSPEDDRSKLLQSQKAAFFFKLERELEKVFHATIMYCYEINHMEII